VLEVPAALAEHADRALGPAGGNPAERLDRLVDFFHGSQGLGFSYRALPTHAVEDTYAAGEGNCLAFTLTFIALARRAGFEAFAREVRIPDQWRREGSAILGIGHVNVGVDTPQRNVIVDFEPDLMRAQRLAQPFRGRRISDRRVLAHFYNNRAAELMLEGRLASARNWVERSLHLDGEFEAALITRGVVSRRMGLYEAAESDFRAALARDGRSVDALANLFRLHHQLGNRQEMIRYGRRLEGLAPDDPYFLWQLARFQRSLGETELARRSLERAVRLDGEQDPMLLAGLAETLFELGQREQARHYLTRARQHGRNAAHKHLAQLDKIDLKKP